MGSIKENFLEAQTVLNNFISDQSNFSTLENAGNAMVSALKAGNKIISCGNGGSMADAMHFAEELTGRFRDDRPAIAALAISDPSHISCVANDYGYDYIFSRYVEAHGKNGDILLAISTSGNSPNVCKAAQTASELGMKIVSLTGKSGGKLDKISHFNINVPHHGYSDRIQEIHIKIIHALINYIELKL